MIKYWLILVSRVFKVIARETMNAVETPRNEECYLQGLLARSSTILVPIGSPFLLLCNAIQGS